jgi:hypothetical protein
MQQVLSHFSARVIILLQNACQSLRRQIVTSSYSRRAASSGEEVQQLHCRGLQDRCSQRTMFHTPAPHRTLKVDTRSPALIANIVASRHVRVRVILACVIAHNALLPMAWGVGQRSAHQRSR